MDKFFSFGLAISAIGMGIFWSPIFGDISRVAERETATYGLGVAFVGALCIYVALILDWRKRHRYC